MLAPREGDRTEEHRLRTLKIAQHVLTCAPKTTSILSDRRIHKAHDQLSRSKKSSHINKICTQFPANSARRTRKNA